jgi:hypothetical protein
LFSGALDLAAGHVAAHDRRDGRQRPERELREPAGQARYGEPVGLGRGGDHGGWRDGQVGHDLV